MNLHGEIMNIEVSQTELATSLYAGDTSLAYKIGHRDARHASAELALKADATIAELLEALKGLLCFAGCSGGDDNHPEVKAAWAAIQSAEGTKP